jgi:hypothetical protein
MLDAEQNAAHIDSQKLIDAGDINLGDAHHGRRNAGVVDQAIDAAEPFDGPRNHRLDVGLVCHVGADEPHLEALFQRLAFRLPACRDNDLGPFLGKELDDFFADAARTAGNDGDFSVQSAHFPYLRLTSGLAGTPSLAMAAAAG